MTIDKARAIVTTAIEELDTHTADCGICAAWREDGRRSMCPDGIALFRRALDHEAWRLTAAAFGAE